MSNSLFRFSFQHVSDIEPYVLKYSPAYWDTQNISLSRNTDLHGIFPTYNNSLGFVNEQRDYINNIYDTYGHDAEIIFKVEILDSKDNYHEMYRGSLNLTNRRRQNIIDDHKPLSTYQSKELVQLCDIDPTELHMKMLSRFNVPVSLDSVLSLEGNGMSDFGRFYGFNMIYHGRAIQQVDKAEEFSNNVANGNFVFGNTTLRLFYMGAVPSADLNQLGAFNENNLITLDTILNPRPQLFSRLQQNPITYLLEYKLTGSFIFENIGGDMDGVAEFKLQMQHGDIIETILDLGAIPLNTLQEYDIKGSFPIELVDTSKGVTFYYEMLVTKTSVGAGQYLFDLGMFYDGSSFISLSALTQRNPQNATSFMIHEALSKSFEYITDRNNVLISNFLGRRDSLPRSYNNDGSASMLAVTNGKLLRGLDFSFLITSVFDFQNNEIDIPIGQSDTFYFGDNPLATENSLQAFNPNNYSYSTYEDEQGIEPPQDYTDGVQALIRPLLQSANNYTLRYNIAGDWTYSTDNVGTISEASLILKFGNTRLVIYNVLNPQADTVYQYNAFNEFDISLGNETDPNNNIELRKQGIYLFWEISQSAGVNVSFVPAQDNSIFLTDIETEVNGKKVGPTFTVNEILNSLDAVYPIGVGIEPNQNPANEAIRLEGREFFYQKEVIHVFNNIPNINIEGDPTRRYNQATIGFDTYEIEDTNSRDGIHARHTRTVPLKKTQLEYEAISSFPMDMYSIEVAKRQRFDIKQNDGGRYDEKNFFISVIRENETFKPETDELFRQVTGLISPSTAYNLKHSVLRMFIRHLDWLNPTMLKYATESYKSTSILLNDAMASVLTAGYYKDIIDAEIIEGEDWQANRDIEPLFNPELITFTTPFDVDLWVFLLNDAEARYKSIAVSDRDTNHLTGFIINVTPRFDTSGGNVMEWILLSNNVDFDVLESTPFVSLSEILLPCGDDAIINNDTVATQNLLIEYTFDALGFVGESLLTVNRIDGHCSITVYSDNETVLYETNISQGNSFSLFVGDIRADQTKLFVLVSGIKTGNYEGSINIGCPQATTGEDYVGVGCSSEYLILGLEQRSIITYDIPLPFTGNLTLLTIEGNGSFFNVEVYYQSIKVYETSEKVNSLRTFIPVNVNESREVIVVVKDKDPNSSIFVKLECTAT